MSARRRMLVGVGGPKKATCFHVVCFQAVRVWFAGLVCRLRASFEVIQKIEAEHLGSKELIAGTGFKICAIVDIVPTGSYQATLKRIGLYCVGFEGFPFGPLYFRPFVDDLAWCRAILNSCEMQSKTHIVLEEVRAGSSFKRCAVVDIVPTGSYQATLKRLPQGWLRSWPP